MPAAALRNRVATRFVKRRWRNVLETTGHGAWKELGRHTFAAFCRFFLPNEDTGSPLGTDNVTLLLARARS